MKPNESKKKKKKDIEIREEIQIRVEINKIENSKTIKNIDPKDNSS